MPTSPYGLSKLMTEIMLRDAGAAHGLRYIMLRYFNVAGADPLGRTGQSTRGATHLIKVAVETALRLRPRLSVFGNALAHLRAGGPFKAAIKRVDELLASAGLTMGGRGSLRTTRVVARKFAMRAFDAARMQATRTRD